LFQLLLLFPEYGLMTHKVAGLRPRSPPDSIVMPQKSQQKKAPELLVLRVPSVPLRFAAQKKTRLRRKHFSSKPGKA
jgi:hypothetical protein